MLMIFGPTSLRRWTLSSAESVNSEYFYLMIKAIRRLLAAITVAFLAFRAVGSFLSWLEHQEDSVAGTWIDEEEFEDV